MRSLGGRDRSTNARGPGRPGNKPNVGRQTKSWAPAKAVTSAAGRISSRTARGAARLTQKLPASSERLLSDLRGQDLFLFSAGLAFYALVSLAPLVILVMWVISLVLGDERVRQLAADMGKVAPKGIGADQALRKVANLGTTVGAWAILTAIWPATAYGAGLRRAFDRPPGSAMSSSRDSGGEASDCWSSSHSSCWGA